MTMFAFADPTELWLELAPVPQAWRPAAYSTAASRWNGYVNYLCLAAMLDWIRAEQEPRARSWLEERQWPSLWEVVSGSVIMLGDRRLALIPTEAIDDGELAVPQEWVDLPGWIADYYLAVQMQLSDGEADGEASWLRVWGYATHHDLKALGQYDAEDRTYSLAADQLTQDWNALWVTMQFCPQVQTRAAVAPLPELAPAQAESLIQRLATQPLPRLAVPFALWGGLIQSPTWRQQLYQQRTQTEARVNLGQWFQQQVSSGWQRLETLLAKDRQLALNLRSGREAADARQVKLISLEDQTVALVVQLSRTEDERVAVLVQVHPAGDASTVPANLELKLLTETGETLQTVQAGAEDSYIQLRRFRCPVGTEFQVKIELGGAQVSERFIM
ncbi:MAG: DUF1822 family protein [Leptolyngbya sp. IPPAS B-1204]|nr:MAG: DUF1822 family protein [Leptolyngbya sp. IPPAS B-1204]